MIIASRPGVVTWASDKRQTDGKPSAYGWHVKVNHEGEYYQSWYCHLNSVAVGVGSVVKQGDILGPAGSTGNSTGVHLHFNIRKQGHYAGAGYAPSDVVDPMPLLNDAPPVPAGIAMPPYFLPAAGDFGDICILANNWGQGDERQQLQRSGNLSYVTKNQNWERRRIASDGIYLEMDTSPGNGEYYTITGSPWLPLSWAVGDEHIRTETVSFFNKATCQPTAAPYTVTNRIRFNALRPSWTSAGGVVLQNVIELQWLIGGIVEEVYWYAPGIGLVAWTNKSGKKSWITERIPVGQQGSNSRESGCFG